MVLQSMIDDIKMVCWFKRAQNEVLKQKWHIKLANVGGQSRKLQLVSVDLSRKSVNTQSGIIFSSSILFL